MARSHRPPTCRPSSTPSSRSWSKPATREKGDTKMSSELAKIEVENLNRSTFLMRGVLAAGAIYGTAAISPMVRKAFGQSSMGDIDILNYALTLEYLEAAF